MIRNERKLTRGQREAYQRIKTEVLERKIAPERSQIGSVAKNGDSADFLTFIAGRRAGAMELAPPVSRRHDGAMVLRWRA